MLENLVMGVVLHEAQTGYDIKKYIEAGIGSFFNASHGNLYPTLKKLADKGYLIMSEQMQGKRLKKYYRTTESGKAAFFKWLSSPFNQNTCDDTHYAKIFFLGELPKEERIKRLQEYEFTFEQMLRQLQAVEKQLPSKNLSDRDYFEQSTFYFSYQIIQNTVRWIKFIKEQKPLSRFLIMGDL